MKKLTVILSAAFAAAAASVFVLVPRAVESSAPAAQTLRVEVREYCETVNGSGSFSYLGQREITSSLPLVVERFSVRAGDEVAVGEEIAKIDRRSSAALIESMGQLRMLAVPASDLETAIAMIPEKITADCEGRVISTAQSGAAIQSGSSIASVSQSAELCVTAAISELDIAKVSTGQKAMIVLAAYPDEAFSGTVTDIAPSARDQYTGSVLETVVDVTITPDTPDERLKSGLSADVEIALEAPRKICVLPYSAIGQDDVGEFVCVYENGSSVRRSITTGAEFSDGAEVVSGVTPSDVVFKEPEKIVGESYIRIEMSDSN